MGRFTSRGRIGLSGVALVVVVLAIASPAVAQLTSSGSLAIESEDGGPIFSGESRTPFNLRIPPGAECQGDSADDGYVVHSFMIPSNDDPGALTFRPQPQGENRYPLYLATTGRYSNQLTQDAPELGDPGVLDQPGLFSFEAFEGAEIPSGEYRIGIACSFDGATTRYWDTLLVVNRSSADQPAEYSFVVPGASSSSGDGETSRSWVIVGLAGLLLVLAVTAIAVRRRSARPSSRSSKESS